LYQWTSSLGSLKLSRYVVASSWYPCPLKLLKLNPNCSNNSILIFTCYVSPLKSIILINRMKFFRIVLDSKYPNQRNILIFLIDNFSTLNITILYRCVSAVSFINMENRFLVPCTTSPINTPLQVYLLVILISLLYNE